MKKKTKVASVLTAGVLAATMGANALAASSRYHTTYTKNGESYYTDSYGNEVHTDYVITNDGVYVDRKYCRFDEKDNVIDVNYSYDHNMYPNYPEGYYNDYPNYNNYPAGTWFPQTEDEYTRFLEEEHLNIDINVIEDKRNFFAQHRKSCTNPTCNYGYDRFYSKTYAPLTPNNGYDNNYNDNYYNNYQPNYQTKQIKFYTLVKQAYGQNVYAYSPVPSVEQYGIYGWTLNSEYNANDYGLNSVFYEEFNTFGNDFRFSNIASAIVNANNLFVWRYSLPTGEVKYCLSNVQYPQSVYSQDFDMSIFTYNSKFNMNDLNELKTVSAAMEELKYYGYTRAYTRY